MTSRNPGQGNLPAPSRARNRSSATGKFVPSADTAERDAEAARMRTDGMTYKEIAKALGYASEGTAYDAAHRALTATRRDGGEDLKRVELDRLDMMYQAAMGVLRREHLAHGNGRIVYKECNSDHAETHPAVSIMDCRGIALHDSGPELAAIKTLLDIQGRRAKLEGLDSPTRHSVDAEALGREILEMLRGASGGRAGEVGSDGE